MTCTLPSSHTPPRVAITLRFGRRPTISPHPVHRPCPSSFASALSSGHELRRFFNCKPVLCRILLLRVRHSSFITCRRDSGSNTRRRTVNAHTPTERERPIANPQGECKGEARPECLAFTCGWHASRTLAHARRARVAATAILSTGSISSSCSVVSSTHSPSSDSVHPRTHRLGRPVPRSRISCRRAHSRGDLGANCQCLCTPGRLCVCVCVQNRVCE